MKRDIELARKILLAVFHHAGSEGIDRHVLKEHVTGVNADDFSYHVKLLLNARYLVLEQDTVQLTWSGHDLLDLLTKDRAYSILEGRAI